MGGGGSGRGLTLRQRSPLSGQAIRLARTCRDFSSRCGSASRVARPDFSTARIGGPNSRGRPPGQRFGLRFSVQGSICPSSWQRGEKHETQTLCWLGGNGGAQRRSKRGPRCHGDRSDAIESGGLVQGRISSMTIVAGVLSRRSWTRCLPADHGAKSLYPSGAGSARRATLYVTALGCSNADWNGQGAGPGHGFSVKRNRPIPPTCAATRPTT